MLPPRPALIDLLLRALELSEDERDHGLGAIEVTEGERWFAEFCDQVWKAIEPVLTPGEKRTLYDRLF